MNCILFILGMTFGMLMFLAGERLARNQKDYFIKAIAWVLPFLLFISAVLILDGIL